MRVDLDSIPAYLYFGYVPHRVDLAHIGDRSLKVGCCDHPLTTWHETSLIELGVDILLGAFRFAVTETGVTNTHVLPLSGGLDSRAILGGLLTNLDSRQVQVATFGTPGTWDYEIGQEVARAAGVRCESFDLTAQGWQWRTEELVETAARTRQPIWVFDAHVNRQIPRRYGTDCVYWSGFMGDPLAGSHLLPEESPTWEQAKSHFASHNLVSRSLNLTPPSFDPESCLPKSPFIDANLLSYDEQIDFGIRQQCLIRHIVLPKGYDYQTPFLHPEWVDFILTVPRQYRVRQRLYREILNTAFPHLFSLPTKTNLGLPLDAPRWRQAVQLNKLRFRALTKRLFPTLSLGIAPQTNYIDFDQGLRDRADLRQVVYENIQDLKERKILVWLDLDAIWQRHQRKKANHADALTLLASLEINLKAMEASP